MYVSVGYGPETPCKRGFRGVRKETGCVFRRALLGWPPVPHASRRRASRRMRPNRGVSPLDNAAFRRWFGDSKVVDEHGEPLVVYHGGFDAVRNEPHALFLGTEGKLGAGIYLTPHKSLASMYVGKGALLKLYARVQRPLIVHLEDVNPISDALFRATGVRHRFDGLRPSAKWYGDDTRRAVLGAGFDGIFASNHVYGALKPEHQYLTNLSRFVSEIVVFDPRQIKSATDNVGTYDPENPSILKNGRRTSRRRAR
jgi:hypothetical protein